MKSANITKLDIPSVRAAAAQIPMENLVVDRWNEINQNLNKVTTEQSIFEMQVVLFMSAKVLRVLAEDINFRGVDSSLEAIEKVEKIKSEVEEMLTSLKQSTELGRF